MYQFLQYLKFLCTSTNQHGVHSPFVYDLVTQCFYANTDKEIESNLNAYRKALLLNNDILNIIDYGAGSRKLKSSKRSLKQITKTSGTTLKRAKLLYRIVNYLKPKQVLELGTSLGIATQAMALDHQDTKVTSIEGCPSIAAVAKQQLEQFNIKNVELKTGPFEDYLPTLQQQTWDLIFLDGNHQKEPTLQYFETLLASITNDSVFILDDIYWSKGMTKAWEVIKQHPKVTVTIDTFFWGLVFFRKEQNKENFKIRV